MFRDTAATGESAWTPSSGGLPTNFETPVEVLGDSSGDSDLQYNDDDIEKLSLTQTPNPTQTTNPTQPPNPTQSPQEMRKKRVGTVMQSK
jgi:hypothetical protein